MTNFEECCKSPENMAAVIDSIKCGWTKEKILEWLKRPREPRKKIRIAECAEYFAVDENNVALKDGFDTRAEAEEWVEKSINSGSNWELLREAKALHEVFKEGDTAYVTVEGGSGEPSEMVCEMTVKEIAKYGKLYDCQQYINVWNLHLVSFAREYHKPFHEIGKTVFVSKDAAEQRIAANKRK